MLFPKIAAGFFALWMLLNGAGCAPMRPAETVQAGQRVTVQYTCRNIKGEVLTATSGMTDSGNAEKVEYFWPAPKDPLLLVAGQADDGAMSRLRKVRPLGFSEQLAHQLSTSVMGLPYDRKQTLSLSSSPQNQLPDDARYLRMGRFRKRLKRMEGSTAKYSETTGKIPKVGDSGPEIHRGFVTRVARVNDDQIVLETVPPDGGNTVETPFGKAIVHDDGDYHRIELDVHEGKVIRTGDNLGVVYKVDDRFFYIDYGHPYGGIELTCDVQISAADKSAGE
jgi:FKBP-type peptidyl-prolyl cis-trans isomerase 2